MNVADLGRTPNPLAPHYSRFRVAERLLLTGHSHQAWPDAGFEAQQEAWLDAARHVDDKWDAAFRKADRVKAGFAKLLGDAGDGLALGQNTHELVVRLLSAVDLRGRPRLVTTDGEFHSIRRQVDRLAEAGVQVVKVAERPVESLGERLAAAVDDRTALVMVSLVFFDTGRIVRGLRLVADACAHHGSELLVDAYHALNVVPVDLASEGLQRAYVVGGGYKYCQLGEGNCFLRIPAGCRLRPVITGWYSEFSTVAEDHRSGVVEYGPGSERFAGATHDPTSNYRAAAVFDFFDAHRLGVDLLREVSQHQIGLLAATFDALDLDPAVVSRDRSAPLTETAGFLALQARDAVGLYRALHRRGVFIDTRGDALRFGPAPYLSDRQLREAMEQLGEVAR